MKPNYKDIIDRIPEEPKWFDAGGVPRYEPFHPDLRSNIYADECVLLLINCQNCGKQFEVEKNRSKYDQKVPDSLESQHPEIYYGDPPNTGCCSVGPTMSSETIWILQFWSNQKAQWVRKQELEVRVGTPLDHL